MKEVLVEQLLKITPEEQDYLNGKLEVDKNIYTRGNLSEVDKAMLLERGQLVTVRPNSRFVDFPAHKHNYIEIMYICNGSITHYIEDEKIVMNKGDILFLNQYIKHSIKKAGYTDIGINFIALPEFFEIPLRMLNKENILADFIVDVLCQKNQIPQYLLFNISGNMAAENLMENMIDSMINKKQNQEIINQYSMGLVFLYLLQNIKDFNFKSSVNYKEAVIQYVLKYIDSDYRNANLSEIAEISHQSLSVLSKLIKQRTGYNFQQLLQRKRFEKSLELLQDTKLTVDEIAAIVGYENQSYFYRQFKKRYNMTPKEYRIHHKEEKDQFIMKLN